MYQNVIGGKVTYSDKIVFDDKDAEIYAKYLTEWNERKGPRVGDYIRMLDGSLRRFTYHWGDSIQTTTKDAYAYGCCFYFGGTFMSFSGGLDSAIPLAQIEPTDEILDGNAWFFHHGFADAHRGVHFTVPCRVFVQVASPEKSSQ